MVDYGEIQKVRREFGTELKVFPHEEIKIETSETKRSEGRTDSREFPG